ncbi:fimbrial biogenesis chaperone [Achromobacter xylosoxidans]|uniref:Pili assembly chaperone N-terminal domain-containing protein n=1 Tax=Alcaligenes xylosoxydans xylosoxydans TaxID=85698 RepID=A0A1R1JTT5_ALCXX|nr:molecular chaperone [Achromobacter xylosoxidans]OMG86448.1 hypothetical protein BIZ92_26735 [Achromobacter xylosoxidans]BEG74851.1 hypothetical protein HBIAX_01900 [Achromobacter xylosoxidans]
MNLLVRTLGVLILCMALPAASMAQSSLLVWPIDPTIEHDQNGTALWLENTSKTPARMQIRVLGWSQADGEDDYTPQDVVVVSPPAAEVQPGQRQLLRLIRAKPVAAGTERAFRVLIDEIPPAPPSGDEDPAAGPAAAPGNRSVGLALQMRYSVPLFVSGEGVWTRRDFQKPRDMTKATQPRLKFRLEFRDGGQWLVMRNEGQAHARLSAVTYQQGGRKAWEVPGLLGYVLAQSEMRFKVSGIAAGGVLQAKVNSNPDAQAIPAW